MTLEDEIAAINTRFLANCSEVFNYEWSKVVPELIATMSFDFATLRIPALQGSYEILTGDTPNDVQPDIHELLAAFLLFLKCNFDSKPQQTKNITALRAHLAKADYFPLEFFIYNLPQAPELDPAEIAEIRARGSVDMSPLPTLDFDPLYRKALDCPAVHFLLQDPLDPNSPYFCRDCRLTKPETQIITRWERDRRDEKKQMMNYYLGKASGQLQLTPEIMAPLFKIQSSGIFGSSRFRKEFFASMEGYYAARLPGERAYIHATLVGIEAMFQLAHGQIVANISYNQVKQALKASLSEGHAQWFLDRFIADRHLAEFHLETHIGPPSKLLYKFMDFVTKAGYYSMGRIYTGCYVIWKALLSYFDELIGKPAFEVLRGALLEVYCLETARDLGLGAKKLIITPPAVEKGELYQQMRNQIRDFPQDAILEVSVNFPPDMQIQFMEIDVALRAGPYLILVEAKSVHSRYGIMPNILVWNSRIKEEKRHLKNKVHLLSKFLPLTPSLPPFLQGVKRISWVIVKPEGLFGMHGVKSLAEYRNYLASLAEALEKGKMDAWGTANDSHGYWQESEKKS